MNDIDEVAAGGVPKERDPKPPETLIAEAMKMDIIRRLDDLSYDQISMLNDAIKSGSLGLNTGP